MEGEVRRFRFPPSSYPRYRHAVDCVNRLITQCEILFQDCGLQYTPQVPNLADVFVDVFSLENDLSVNRCDLEVRDSQNEENTPFSVQMYCSEESITSAFPRVCIMTFDLYQKIYTHVSSCLPAVLIIGQSFPISCKYSKSLPNINGIANHVSDILVRYVFGYLNLRANVLQCLEGAVEVNISGISEKTQMMLKKQLPKESKIDANKLKNMWCATRQHAWLALVKEIYVCMPEEYRTNLINPQALTIERQTLKQCMHTDLLPIVGSGELIQIRICT